MAAVNGKEDMNKGEKPMSEKQDNTREVLRDELTNAKKKILTYVELLDET